MSLKGKKVKVTRRKYISKYYEQHLGKAFTDAIQGATGTVYCDVLTDEPLGIMKAKHYKEKGKSTKGVPRYCIMFDDNDLNIACYQMGEVLFSATELERVSKKSKKKKCDKKKKKLKSQK